MKQVKLLLVCIVWMCVTACTTAQGTDTLKVISQLLGGAPERSQMLDASVKEALQYEFDRCMSGKEMTAETQSQCIQLAYGTVKEEMNLEERVGEDGRVIIKRIEDDELIYEDTESQDGDKN